MQKKHIDFSLAILLESDVEWMVNMVAKSTLFG